MWAASFKSLYLERPANIMLLRTVAWRGAPDTALRLVLLISIAVESPSACPIERLHPRGHIR